MPRKRGWDEIDHRIIAELTKDSRAPHTEIAARLDLKPNRVSSRISEMKRLGYIRFSIQVSDDTPKHNVEFYILVKLTSNSRQLELEFEPAVKAVKEIYSVEGVAGDWDYILHAGTSGSEEMGKCRDHVANLSSVARTLLLTRLGTV